MPRDGARRGAAWTLLAVGVVGAVVGTWLFMGRGERGGQGGCVGSFAGDPCGGGLYYGASVEGGDPEPLEEATGRPLTLFRSYHQETTPAEQLVSRAAVDLAEGRIPLMSTKLPGPWAAVAAGEYDDWLIERISGLAALDGPVWLALHHEPQGDGLPADWVAMQQHARQLIDEHSSNIALVGILNGSSFLLPGGDPEAYRMPVGTGVHVMGFDSYNPWSPTNGRDWVAADTVLSPGPTIESWGYPVLVGEYGVRDDPTRPFRAARWIDDAYRFAVENDFVAMSYFHSGANSPDGTWQLRGAALDAFVANLDRTSTARLGG